MNSSDHLPEGIFESDRDRLAPPPLFIAFKKARLLHGRFNKKILLMSVKTYPLKSHTATAQLVPAIDVMSYDNYYHHQYYLHVPINWATSTAQ